MSIEQLVIKVAKRTEDGIGERPHGYQPVACSQGLKSDAPALRYLERVAAHYGKLVKTASLYERQSASGSPRPTRIWSYDDLGDERFALTRITGDSGSREERSGGFIAHALVFEPEALAAFDFNPLMLARSDYFPSKIDPADPDLPAITKLDGSGLSSTAYSVLQQESTRAQMTSVVSGLIDCAGGGPRLALLIETWQMAAPLAESLLALLPPSMRCRVSFATYDQVDGFSIETASGEKAHQLDMISGAANSHSASFTGRTVVDLSRDAPMGSAGSAFAGVVEECIETRDFLALRDFHEAIERLGSGRDTDTWDDFVAIVALERASSPGIDGLTAVRRVVRREAQVEPALQLLLSQLEAACTARQYQTAGRVAQTIAELIEGALPPTDSAVDLRSESGGGIAQLVKHWYRQLWSGGSGRNES